MLDASLCNYISVKNFLQRKELQFFKSQCSFLCGALSGYTCFIANLIKNLFLLAFIFNFHILSHF